MAVKNVQINYYNGSSYDELIVSSDISIGKNYWTGNGQNSNPVVNLQIKRVPNFMILFTGTNTNLIQNFFFPISILTGTLVMYKDGESIYNENDKLYYFNSGLNLQTSDYSVDFYGQTWYNNQSPNVSNVFNINKLYYYFFSIY